MASAIFSLAWWALRLGDVREAAGRFLNRGSVIALAVAAFAATAAIAGGMTWASVKSSIAVARDAVWSSRLAEATLEAHTAKSDRDRLAAEAAARARETADEREALISRVTELEREIQALADDPVIFPQDLVRSLRK